MKLTSEQIASARETTNLSPVPEDHPAIGQLEAAFGEHTFFLHNEGLSIFVDPAQMEMPSGEPRLVLVAAWTDENKNELGAVEPVDHGVTLPA